MTIRLPRRRNFSGMGDMRSTQDILEDLVYTLQQCSSDLLTASDDEIGYRIFEEFDVGIVSFLHPYTLHILENSGLISAHIVRDCVLLRTMGLAIQETGDWNIQAVRNAEQWLEMIRLSDKIRLAIQTPSANSTCGGTAL